MSNIKKIADISIRLPKQGSLPKPQELIEMAHESRRSKKRIELPWHPEGRPEPAVLTVEHADNSGEATWSILSNNKSDATIDWTEVDPDPTKIVLALRDWYARIRETETWAKTSAGSMSIKPSPPGPQQQQSPPAYLPYPQHPGGVPVWNPQFYGSYQYPNQAVPPAPPHWAQSAPGNSTGQQPLPPELWAVNMPQQPASNPPLIGDLLVAAGVIPTRSVQAALTLQNMGTVDRKRIGEILVNSGALPTNVMAAAVKLQEMARSRVITHQRVTELLRQIYATSGSLEDLLVHISHTQIVDTPPTAKHRADQLNEDEGQVTKEEQEKLTHVLSLVKELSDDNDGKRATQLLDLLVKASILSDDAVITELLLTKNSSVDTVKSLLAKERLDPATFEAAVACQKLIKLERFKVEQAVIALGYCSRSRVTLRDAICDLNWLIPIDGI